MLWKGIMFANVKNVLYRPPKPHFKLSSELKEISILMELDMTNGFLLNDLVSE